MPLMYEQLKKQVADLIYSAGRTDLDTVREYLSYCDEHLTPADFTEEEQQFFGKLARFLADGGNAKSLGLKEYYRILCDLLWTTNKLEGGSDLSTKGEYFHMAAQFADEATVVDDEKEHANDLVLSYLKKAEELYDGLTDLDRRRKAVGCPNCSKKQAWEKSQSSSSSTVSTGYRTNPSSGGFFDDILEKVLSPFFFLFDLIGFLIKPIIVIAI